MNSIFPKIQLTFKDLLVILWFFVNVFLGVKVHVPMIIVSLTYTYFLFNFHLWLLPSQRIWIIAYSRLYFKFYVILYFRCFHIFVIRRYFRFILWRRWWNSRRILWVKRNYSRYRFAQLNTRLFWLFHHFLGDHALFYHHTLSILVCEHYVLNVTIISVYRWGHFNSWILIILSPQWTWRAKPILISHKTV